MSIYPQSLQKIIQHFAKLPGIGPKTAQRLVFYLLDNGFEDFARDLDEMRGQITRCETCSNISQAKTCPICADLKRDHSTIAVIAKPQDIEAIERSREFTGVYHILGGLLSPLDGKVAKDLRIAKLETRIKEGNPHINEIILAFDNNIEGESTAIYISKLLKPLHIKVTRLARGLPVGSDLEYADEVTLKDAVKHRWEI